MAAEQRFLWASATAQLLTSLGLAARVAMGTDALPTPELEYVIGHGTLLAIAASGFLFSLYAVTDDRSHENEALVRRA